MNIVYLYKQGKFHAQMTFTSYKPSNPNYYKEKKIKPYSRK